MPISTPLPYEPSVEKVEADEAETVAALIEQFHKIAETTWRDNGHATRAVHAKAHGVLKGELTVLGGLPPTLAQGLFAKPGSYPTFLRFSTSPGDILPDDVSTPRGLALKIAGVEGGRLPGSENAATQDFLLVTGKAFLAPNPKAFLKNLKLLAATTDKAERGKEILSAVLRGTEKVVETFGGESATLKSLGGYPETHILGESFFSQVPIRYGDYIAKIGVFPVSPGLTRLTDAPLDVNGKPNGLRQAVGDYFAASEGVWELRVQLCTDLAVMPVEDATVVWPEDKSPYVAVARLTMPIQTSWSDENVAAIDTGMSFSPWHGLAAHRPLGAIMRARRAVYEASAAFRGEKNGCPMHEPAAAVAAG
jgi:hypothetical protein